MVKLAKQNSSGSGQRGGRSGGGGGLLDRNIAPRVEEFLSRNAAADADDVAEHLRAAYKEYQRVKLGPFRVMVNKALQIVRGRSESGPRDAPTQDDAEDGSSSEDSEAMADDEPQPTRAMNSSILNMYQKTVPAAAAPDAVAPPDQVAAASLDSGLGAATAAMQVDEGTAPPAAPVAPGDALAPQRSAGEAGPSGRDAAKEKRIRADEGEATGGKPKKARPVRAKTAAGDRRGGSPDPGAAPSSSRREPLPIRFADLGGIEPILSDIRELVECPLAHPEVYAWLGVEPPRGVLLHGPPGCGKTALANAIANECGVPFFRVSAPEVVAGVSGESEARLRDLFREAKAAAPCIVFFDEIDAIATRRESAQREMERRIVAQLLICMDDLGASSAPEGENGEPEGPPRHVVVIGATNRPDALDPALRRAGRFDREIAVGVPTEASRARIMEVLCKRLRLEGGLDLLEIARRTPGFVGADLAALTKEAAALAVRRIVDALSLRDAHEALAAADASIPPSPAEDIINPRMSRRPLTAQELETLAITSADFQVALGKVQPSVRREGFATTPDVSWEDVGSLEEVRDELSFAITLPVRYPKKFEAMGLPAATGVLLFGPPGCGKTLVAKAVARESGANFISIKGPELLNKYVGESERAVRQVFSRARAAAPCVLFFDEMDALAPRRGGGENQAAERVVNMLLTEMDGVEGRHGVFLVAATNRPDMIDPALLRPGRLDKVLYVPLPPADGRVSILRALCRKTPLAPDVDVAELGARSSLEGYSGADLKALVNEASVLALKEASSRLFGTADMEPEGMDFSPLVTPAHFDAALRKVQPSVSRRDQKVYDQLRSRIRSSRAHLQPDNDAAPGDREGLQLEGGGPNAAMLPEPESEKQPAAGL